MENGDIILCKSVVSSVGIRNTFKTLIDENSISKKILLPYEEIMNNIDSSVFHMYCFVKLKGTPEELGLRSSNMWIYPHRDYENLFEDFLQDPIDNPMPLFIAFSCKKDLDWNNKYQGYSNAVVLGVINKKTFEEYENTKINKRGDRYDFLKELLGDRMINDGLLKYFPHLESKIEDINIASPLTTKHYINSYYGESYGLDMSKKRLLHGEKLRPKTDIKNLYLTGQDICSIGVTGGMLSGVLTANVMLGYDNLVDIYFGNTIITDLKYLNDITERYGSKKFLECNFFALTKLYLLYKFP